MSSDMFKSLHRRILCKVRAKTAQLKVEIDHLEYSSALHHLFEQGMLRFWMDYIDGDTFIIR